jgi:hypothetical protein
MWQQNNAFTHFQIATFSSAVADKFYYLEISPAKYFTVLTN